MSFVLVGGADSEIMAVVMFRSTAEQREDQA